MELKQIIALIIAVPIGIGLLYLLWVKVRFAIISEIKTKGAKERLKVPDAEGVSSICGFLPPSVIVEFFRSSDVIERLEFQFVDTRSSPPKGWFIGNFIPMSQIDAKEWQKITGVNGLPIADNCDGGTYYLTEAGAIYLSDPRNHKEDLLVTEKVEEFTRFSPLESPADLAEQESAPNP